MNVSFIALQAGKDIRIGSDTSNPTFKQTLMLHKMSALVSPNGQETIVPAAVFACEKCGHVNKEFADVAGIQ